MRGVGQSRFDRAFSLMETVVSIALLGFIVVLVLNIFPGSIVATRSASEQIAAENLAQSFIEESRSVEFSSLIEGTEVLVSPDPLFTVEREIFGPAGADVEQTLAIKVTVRWKTKARSREIVREVWISNVRS